MVRVWMKRFVRGQAAKGLQISARRRGVARKKVLLGILVAVVIGVGAVGGVAWWRANTPWALSAKAQLAMDQGDFDSAARLLNRALSSDPKGDIGVRIRTQMGKAMILAGREADARPHLSAALAQKPGDSEALGQLAESYSHGAMRRFKAEPRPITPAAGADIVSQIESSQAELAKIQPPLAGTAEAYAAQAQLDRLYFVVHMEQIQHARAAAENKADAGTAKAATELLATLEKDPYKARRDRAYEALGSALQKDPKNAMAAQLSARYHLDDAQTYAKDPKEQAAHFAAVKSLYEEMKSRGVRTQDLTISAADAIITDDRTEPRLSERAAKARAILEDFLTTDAKNLRALVALGRIQLDSGDKAGAEATAAKALGLAPEDLSAQLLNVNCRWRRGNPADAVALLTKMTSAHGNVPRVWAMRGLANHELKDHRAAEDDFRRALSLSPGYVEARRGLLLVYQAQARESDAAAKSAVDLAGRMIHDDRFYMPAWATYTDALRRDNQANEARQALVDLSRDPAIPEEAKPDLVRLLAVANAPEAADALLATIRGGDNDPAMLSLRAQVAAVRSDEAGARKLLAEAVAAKPTDPELRISYAEALLRGGLTPDARVQLDAASKGELSPEQSLRMARGYLALRMPKEASAAAQRVLKQDSRHAEAQAIAAQAAATLNEQPVVLANVNMEQSSVGDLVRLGTLALQQKDYNRALTMARAAATREPANVLVKLVEARALFALNQVDEATSALAAAAKAKPGEVQPYVTLVQLFEANPAAGIPHAGKFSAHNAAMADWAMGRLAVLANQPDEATRHFEEGLRAAAKSPDPAAAKEYLYTGIERLASERLDDAAYAATIDRLASDPSLAPGLRLAAAERFVTIGNAPAAKEQLAKLEAKTPPAQLPAQMAWMVAGRWGAAGDPQRGLALLAARDDAQSPESLATAAMLQQQAGALDKALVIRRTLTEKDPSNPAAWIGLAMTQAASGDVPGALASLKRCESVGQTGAVAASAARIRLFTNLGLLQAAMKELSAEAGRNKGEDAITRLSLGQAYASLRRADEARPLLESIPPYAAEFAAARITLANLAADAGKADEAVTILRTLADQLGKDRPTAASLPLCQALVRAGKAGEALAYANTMRDKTLAQSPANNAWTLRAAAAAREAKQYDVAVDLLNSLKARLNPAAVATDVALLRLVQGKPADTPVSALTDDAPAFDRTTVKLLTTPPATDALRAAGASQSFLERAAPGSVLALFAATPVDGWKALLSGPAAKTSMFHGDLETLINQLSPRKNASDLMRRLALAQRLLEAGWSTSALDVLDAVDAADPAITHAAVARQQALLQLRRTKEADAIREKLARSSPDVASVRFLTAQAQLAVGRLDDAYASAAALAKSDQPRADVLTLQAQIEERRGNLDEAIRFHREVRSRFPDNVPAANNLAYLLAQRSTDATLDPAKRAELLKQARNEITWAISKMPDANALNDTRGWIDILDNKAPEGVNLLTRAAPFLRLEPAVHYHLGMGYAKLGDATMARLHLENVRALAEKRNNVPEVALASEELKALRR